MRKSHHRARKFLLAAVILYILCALLMAVTWFASWCVGGSTDFCAQVFLPIFGVPALLGTTSLIVAAVDFIVGDPRPKSPPPDTSEYEEKFYSHH